MVKKIADFLIFSNIYVAVPIACLTIQSFVVFDVSIHWLFVVHTYVATLFLYNLHRLRGLNHILKNDVVNRHLWARNNQTFLKLLTLVSGIITLALGLYYPTKFYLHVLPLLLLVFGYVFPVIKIEKRWFRIRDISVIKALVISASVSYLTLVIPLMVFGNQQFSILPFVERFLFVLAITIPFDIRDKTFDSHSKLKTIPLVLGVQNAKILSALLLILSGVVFGLYHENNMLILAELVFILVVLYIIYKTHEKRSEYFYSFLVEGTMILQSLLFMGVLLLR